MKSIQSLIVLFSFLFSLQSGYAQSDSSTVEAIKDTTLTAEKKGKNPDYQSLFRSEPKAFGGYFAINSHYTEINNNPSLLIGAELTAVINHSFNIGIQGYGLVTPNETGRETEFGDPTYLALGYGGIKMEGVSFSNSVVHVTFPVLLGAGGITEYSKNYYGGYYQPYNYEYNYDYFFVVEPGVELEVNVLKFMRLTTGASYRITSEFDIIGMQDNNLNGFNFDLSLKFGWF